VSGAHLPNDTLIQELQRRRQLHQAQLTSYREKEACYQSWPEPPRQEQYRYLTLRRGIRYEQDWIDWCDEVLTFLKQSNSEA
jgi:hypothetical protein